MIKNIWLCILIPGLLLAQQKKNKFTKRVLANPEIDYLLSYYQQKGDSAAVTGGIGDEYLNDKAMDITISIPVSSSDVLQLGYTISAYTSASSSNLNPFTGASEGEDDDDDDWDKYGRTQTQDITGTPWKISTGPSKEDVWMNWNVSYSHYSNDRNKIYRFQLSTADEFDYHSTGGGLGFTYLFNRKNTEINLNSNFFFDFWRPQYPTEIITYFKTNGNLNREFFKDVNIYDQNGNPINKNSPAAWKPAKDHLITTTRRNTYVFSFSLAQILTRKIQMALISDIIFQSGWLANPMQRVYFADRPNFYIGDPNDIPFYTSRQNQKVFQLADDIERLPDTRLKIPVGIRLNAYINEVLTLNSFYRYYFDDWGIHSHTFRIEIPVKLGNHFTFYPRFRYYTQTASIYYAGYEKHLSTEKYYTSDFDLSAYSAFQYGLGIRYTDAFLKFKLWHFGMKYLTLDYAFYDRLHIPFAAHILTLGMKWIVDY